MKRILSLTRRCIEDHAMIAEGDRIAVGLSGGKDSVLMLCALNALRSFYPKKFGLCAISLDLGFDGADFSSLVSLCKNLDIEYRIVATDIKKIIFDYRKEKNPCSLCAKMRRGVLNGEAVSMGCNKVALGHNFDDLIETFFLNLFYEGRIGSFLPVTYLDRSGVTVIRPFIYIHESAVIKERAALGLPVVKNPCPADGNTKRQYIKEHIEELEKLHPGIKERFFGAIMKNIDGG